MPDETGNLIQRVPRSHETLTAANNQSTLTEETPPLLFTTLLLAQKSLPKIERKEEAKEVPSEENYPTMMENDKVIITKINQVEESNSPPPPSQSPRERECNYKITIVEYIERTNLMKL